VNRREESKKEVEEVEGEKGVVMVGVVVARERNAGGRGRGGEVVGWAEVCMYIVVVCSGCKSLSAVRTVQ
jgi:hypothetical protein